MGYNVGIDIRTEGVGWCVTNESGQVLRKNGRHLFGTSVFEEASTAKERKRYRTQRRQQDRQETRIDILQSLMEKDVLAADDVFYLRLDDTPSRRGNRRTDNLYSTLPETLFEDGTEKIMDRETGRKSIQIYKIREALIREHKKADIRYVYLAIAHILKHRGYFTESSGSTRESRRAEAAQHMELFLQYIDDEYNLNLRHSPDGALAFVDAAVSDSEKKAEDMLRIAEEEFSPGINGEKIIKAAISLILGGSIDLGELLPTGRAAKKRGQYSFAALDNSLAVDRLAEEPAEALQHLQEIYDWVYHIELEKHIEDRQVSAEMNRRYEQHRQDLKDLKAWFKKYRNQDEYKRFFHSDNEPYNYNAYVKSRTGDTNQSDKWQHCTQEKFYYELKKYMLDTNPRKTENSADSAKIERENQLRLEGVGNAEPILSRMFRKEKKITDKNKDCPYGEVIHNGFLPLQRISINSEITNRQQIYELEIILENQSEYYASLRENRDKILKLGTFRIPYFVGPLRQTADSAFTPWIQYKSKGEGHIMPWTLEDRVDLPATAENWIGQATNSCTFLIGEKVLPKHSLIYEEYMLLNELNDMYVMYDDAYRAASVQPSMEGTDVEEKEKKPSEADHKQALPADIKQRLIDEVFARQKRVSVGYVCKWLAQNAYRSKKNIRLVSREGSPVEKFHTSLNARVDMEKILGRKVIVGAEENLEKIIKWSTLYTERGIYIRRLREEMKDLFTPAQLLQLEGLNYTGWGRYGKELLCGPLCILKGKTASVLEIMRHRHENFMKIYHDKNSKLMEGINQFNHERQSEVLNYEDVAALSISPAMKRAVWTAVKVLGEIRRVMKSEPAIIFIRNMRETNYMKNQLENESTTRYEHIRAFYQDYEKKTGKKLDPALKAFVQGKKNKKISDVEYLYMLQLGRCMYSGEKINLNMPATYFVDYVVPLDLASDETISNNRVLVKKNKRVPGAPLAKQTIDSMEPFWETLQTIGMITKTKLFGLKIIRYEDQTFDKFMKNQITENNLLVEKMTSLLRGYYPASSVYGINSKLTNDIRKEYDLYRINELNDMQQAYDAFLTAHLGSFIAKEMPKYMEDGGKFQIQMKKLERGGVTDKNGIFVARYKKTYNSEEDEEVKDRKGGDKNTDKDAKEGGDYLKQVYSWHDGFVTRKTREYTGKYYFETRYRTLDETQDSFLVSRNGSHKQAYVAYMAAIRYTVKKEAGKRRPRKKKAELAKDIAEETFNPETKEEMHETEWTEVVNIPAFIAAQPSRIMPYIQGELGFNEGNGYTNVRIVRDKLLLNTEIRLDNHYYYLRTASEWINAKQLFIKKDHVASVHKAMTIHNQEEEADDSGKKRLPLESTMETEEVEKLRETAAYLLNKQLTQYPIYGKLNKSLENAREALGILSIKETILLIKALVYSMGTRSERIQKLLKDVESIGINGDNRLSNKRLRTDGEIEIVHSSVTGLYSRIERL